MLSQLLVLFGFFSLVLVLVYWINQAVKLFDQLIASGQSAGVFLEFTALSLPNVILLVLPISTFAAVVYVMNRLSNESELVVVQAAGYGPLRLARPVIVFSGFVAVMMLILAHVLVPAASRQLAVRSAEVSDNITARFLVDGKFLHPAQGITFYIRSISSEGVLNDVFLTDVRDPGVSTTYTAKRALVVREETGPKLLMFEGIAQTLRSEGQRLFTTAFQDFVFDIGSLVSLGSVGNRRVGQLSTLELLSPTQALMTETGASSARMTLTAHLRFSQPLLALVAALIGFSCLLVGNFSRFGVWRQILLAIILLILVKTLDNAMSDIALRSPQLWAATYGAIPIGLAISAIVLWFAAHPGRVSRLWRRPA